MGLDKAGLKVSIKSLLTDMLEKEDNSIEEFATRLSDTIDAFVKTGVVNVTVTTTGSSSAQSGTGTGGIT